MDSLTIQLQANDDKKVVRCQYYLTTTQKMESTCDVPEALWQGKE